jgi:hypothetical protein
LIPCATTRFATASPVPPGPPSSHNRGSALGWVVAALAIATATLDLSAVLPETVLWNG